MSIASSSFNQLVDLSLARIFSFLPPNERVRVERVSRKWGRVAKKYAWTEFRTLALGWKEYAQEAKFSALFSRCGPYLREFGTVAPQWQCNNMELWAKMRNLRHLRFDSCVSSTVLRAVADNLKRLQSIYLSDIDWRDNDSIVALRDLLRINNASLQALRLPVHTSRGAMPEGALPALPASLRSLHIVYCVESSLLGERKDTLLDELLDLAASCCPQLAILMLPEYVDINRQSIVKLAQFKALFYLRTRFDLYDDNILVAFGNTLAKIGPQLRALLLGDADSRVLELVAKHCPELEHFSFGGVTCAYTEGGEEGLLSALQSMLQLPRLRSLSIPYDCNSAQMRTKILVALNGLNVKGNLEYLHLFRGWSLSVEFVTNFIQLNPNLRKLVCAIQDNHTPAELDKLKTLLQNMDGHLELELFKGRCPPELMGMGDNSRVRLWSEHSSESISQPLLRQFWGQAMDPKSLASVPDLLGDLND